MVRAATAADFVRIDPQAGVSGLEYGPAVAATLDDDPPFLLAGCVAWKFPEGNATAWLVMLETLPAVSPLRLTRTIRGYLAAWSIGYGWQRIDTSVRTDHGQENKFARCCGFVREGTMLRWGPGGVAYDLYRWEG